jgi:hypothetical protein
MKLPADAKFSWAPPIAGLAVRWGDMLALKVMLLDRPLPAGMRPLSWLLRLFIPFRMVLVATVDAPRA